MLPVSIPIITNTAFVIPQSSCRDWPVRSIVSYCGTAFRCLNTKIPPQSLQTGGKHHGQKDNESYSVSALDHRDVTLLSGRWYSHVIAFRKQLYLFINSFRNSLTKLVKRAGSLLVWRRLQTEGCWPGWPTSGGNPSHPLHHTVVARGSSFSTRLRRPQCRKQAVPPHSHQTVQS